MFCMFTCKDNSHQSIRHDHVITDLDLYLPNENVLSMHALSAVAHFMFSPKLTYTFPEAALKGTLAAAV